MNIEKEILIKFDIKNYEKIVIQNFYKKYSNNLETNEIHSENLIDALIYNKNCHYSSLFKDRLLYDYIDEFLKRYYHKIESIDRIPKMSKYYTNYLNFFCKPIFRDLNANYILKRYGDHRAELYYKNHYDKKEDQTEDANQYDRDNENEDLARIMLTSVIRERINHNSMTEFDIKNTSIRQNINSLEISNLNFYELEESIKSGLITKRDQREESLHNILLELDPVNIDEMFLVNYKKNLVSNFNGNSLSNVDRTTKDYSNKENIIFDINKIEIKGKTIESTRENKIINKDKINENLINQNTSAINKEITNLKISSENENKLELLLANNFLNFNNRTRNRQSIPQKTSQIITENISATYKTFKQITIEKEGTFTQNYSNKILQKIQTKTLSALNKIKNNKLEFRNVITSNDKNNKVVYKDLHKNINENKNYLVFNDLLKNNVKNIKNKIEVKSDLKNSKNLSKNLQYKDVSYISKKSCNDLLSTQEKKSNNISKITLSPNIPSRLNSKSPIIPKEKIVENNNQKINKNSLLEIIDKTKNMSRNKNFNLFVTQTSTNIQNKSINKNKNNIKENQLNPLNSISALNAFKSFKIYKSFNKDPTDITKTVVNLKIPNTKLIDLEKRIFSSYASNYNILKQSVNKNENSKNLKLKSVIKQKEKIMKTFNDSNNKIIGNPGISKNLTNSIKNLNSYNKIHILKNNNLNKIAPISQLVEEQKFDKSQNNNNKKIIFKSTETLLNKNLIKIPTKISKILKI